MIELEREIKTAKKIDKKDTGRTIEFEFKESRNWRQAIQAGELEDGK